MTLKVAKFSQVGVEFYDKKLTPKLLYFGLIAIPNDMYQLVEKMSLELLWVKLVIRFV
jgi:hypothetical protein